MGWTMQKDETLKKNDNPLKVTLPQIKIWYTIRQLKKKGSIKFITHKFISNGRQNPTLENFKFCLSIIIIKRVFFLIMQGKSIVFF